MELERALSERIGKDDGTHDELMKAMCNLLILLLRKYQTKETDEDDEMLSGMKDMIMNKYPKIQNHSSQLIPSPS